MWGFIKRTVTGSSEAVPSSILYIGSWDTVVGTSAVAPSAVSFIVWSSAAVDATDRSSLNISWSSVSFAETKDSSPVSSRILGCLCFLTCRVGALLPAFVWGRVWSCVPAAAA